MHIWLKNARAHRVDGSLILTASVVCSSGRSFAKRSARLTRSSIIHPLYPTRLPDEVRLFASCQRRKASRERSTQSHEFGAAILAAAPVGQRLLWPAARELAGAHRGVPFSELPCLGAMVALTCRDAPFGIIREFRGILPALRCQQVQSHLISKGTVATATPVSGLPLRSPATSGLLKGAACHACSAPFYSTSCDASLQQLSETPHPQGAKCKLRPSCIPSAFGTSRPIPTGTAASTSIRELSGRP